MFLVKWEARLLHHTREDLPKKEDVVLNLSSNHGCVNLGRLPDV